VDRSLRKSPSLPRLSLISCQHLNPPKFLFLSPSASGTFAYLLVLLTQELAVLPTKQALQPAGFFCGLLPPPESFGPDDTYPPPPPPPYAAGSQKSRIAPP